MKMKPLLKSFILVSIISVTISTTCPSSKRVCMENTAHPSVSSEVEASHCAEDFSACSCANNGHLLNYISGNIYQCNNAGNCQDGEIKLKEGDNFICYSNTGEISICVNGFPTLKVGGYYECSCNAHDIKYINSAGQTFCYSGISSLPTISSPAYFKYNDGSNSYDPLTDISSCSQKILYYLTNWVFCYSAISHFPAICLYTQYDGDRKYTCKTNNVCNSNQDFKVLEDGKTICQTSLSTFQLATPCSSGYFQYDSSDDRFKCFSIASSCDQNYLKFVYPNPENPSFHLCYRSISYFKSSLCQSSHPIEYDDSHSKYKCSLDNDCKTHHNYEYSFNSYHICYSNYSFCPEGTSLSRYNEADDILQCIIGERHCRVNEKSYTNIIGDLECYPSACPNNTFEFNNICYDLCPSSTTMDTEGIGCDCLNNYYLITVASGVQHKVCLGISDPCPGSNLYLEDKQCQNSCPTNGNQLRRKMTTVSSFYYECTDQCRSDEFSYTKEESGRNVTYCFNECPITAKYHLSNDTECLSDCDHNYFFTDLVNHLCYETCPGVGLNIPYDRDVTKKGFCISEASCPITHQYLYEGTMTCFDDCKNADKDEFEHSKFLDVSNNTCVKSCYGKYKKGNKCVERCDSNQKIKVISQTEKECISACDNNYPYVYETKECQSTDSCPADYPYKVTKSNQDKSCYQACPDGYYQDGTNCILPTADCSSGKLKKESNKTCINCIREYGFKTTRSKFCYEECPKEFPLYEDNICYEKGNTHLNDLYQKDGTNEFVTSENCDGKIFNHICYESCPANSLNSSQFQTCECEYKKIESNGKTICLGILDNCPSPFEYIKDGKECVTFAKCAANSKLRKLSTSPINYECVAECEPDEFIYTTVQSGKTFTYCMRQCPEDKPYHFYNDTECLSSCGQRKFTDESNYLCYHICPGLNTREETKIVGTIITKVFKCLNAETCPPSYPYYYNVTRSCLSSCSKTKDGSLFLSPTITGTNPNDPNFTEITNETLLDVVSKECVSECPEGLKNDQVNNQCVEECKDEQKQYGDICYSACPSGTAIIYGTNKCASNTDCVTTNNATLYSLQERPKTICYESSCPSNYYQDDVKNLCLNSCSNAPGNNKYIKESTKMCQKCDIPSGSTIFDNEGYFISTDNPKICYNSCPSNAPYHNDNGNECFSRCNTNGKKCHFDGGKICFSCSSPSCNYTINDICYTDECPANTELTNNTNSNECHCKYKYLQETGGSGYKTCLSENRPCPVDQPYYNGESSNSKYLQCSSTACTAKTRKERTNPINYECISQCNDDEFIYTSGTVKLCVSECPEIMPYHIFNGTNKNCLSSCDARNYYVDSINHICYEKCPDLSILDENDLENKKGFCLTSTTCPPYAPYLYEPTRTCLSSCSHTKISSITPHETTKLDETNNECIFDNETCRFFYDNSTGHCKEDCDNNQYKYLGINKTCYDSSDDCVNSGLYFIEELKECLEDCSDKQYFTIDDQNIKKCYISCPDKYYSNEDTYNCSLNCNQGKYKKITNKKCVSCDGPANVNYLQENEGFRIDGFCYNKCPDHKPFYIQGGNECYNENDTALNDLLRIEGTNEYTRNCVGYKFNHICYSSSCPANAEVGTGNECKCSFKYYEKEMNSDEIVKICLSINDPCPSDFPYYGSDKKCTNETCAKYREIRTNPVNYECVDGDCGLFEYEYQSDIYGNSSMCISACPEDKPYHVYNKKICYSNCSEAEQSINKDYFIDDRNKICYETHDKCPGLNSYILSEDGSLKKDKCLTQTACPQDYYYFDITKSCIENCSFTDFDFFEGKDETFANDIEKICLSRCKGGQFIDKTKVPEECVNECDPELFIFEKTCIENCTSTSLKSYDYDTRKCIDTDCTGKGYYIIENGNPYECYKSCPKSINNEPLYQDEIAHKCRSASECLEARRYIKDSIQKCISCSNPENTNSIKEDEGFIIDSDVKVCADACNSSAPFYNYKDNKCYEENSTSLKEFNIENTYIYTDSCPLGYYLFNSICYKDRCPENTQYESTITRKCKCSYKFIKEKIDEKDVYDCLSLSQNCPDNRTMFHKVDGCIERCPKKTRYTKSTDTSYSDNYECLDHCAPLEYSYKDDSTFGGLPIDFCVDKCPDGYYHNYQEFDCFEQCNETEYFVDEVNKICYKKQDCLKVKLINESSNALGECLASNKCPLDTVLYIPNDIYNNHGDGYCLPNCTQTKNNDYQTLFQPLETLLYEDAQNNKKTCISDCNQIIDKKYLDVEASKCVAECGPEQFKRDYKCYNNCSEAPGSVDFYREDTRECVNETECSNKNMLILEELDDHICYKNCPNKITLGSSVYKLYKVYNQTKCVTCNSNQGFYIPNDEERLCYDHCPDDAIRFNNGTNKCFNSKCENPFSYEQIDNGIHECVSECGPDYKVFNFECYKDCDLSGNQLITDDSDSNRCKCKYNFYIDETKDFPEIKCLASGQPCPNSHPYLGNSTNECLAQCPLGTYSYDKSCYENCTDISRLKKESNKQCVSCELPTSSNSLRDNEGFKVDGEDICYDACPDGKRYHDADGNECKESCTTSKINRIENTYECINDCPTGYILFNYICYKDKCPENSELDSTRSSCICSYRHYNKTIDGKEYRICLGKNEPCPEEKKYYGNTNECTNVPCTTYSKQISLSIVNYQCLVECPEDEFVFKSGPTGSQTKSCVKQCPDHMPFHQANNSICLSSCTKFTDKANHLCYDECPGLFTIDETDLAHPKGECLKEEKCPLGTKRYAYQDGDSNYCLSDCSITSNNNFPNHKKSYRVVEIDESNSLNSNYLCVSNCATVPSKKYVDEAKGECVGRCGENNGGEYLYQGKCYDKCSTANTNLYYLSDTKECVDSCPNGYYKEETDKACYKTCPLTNTQSQELFMDEKNKICSICNIPTNPDLLTANEGFIIKNEQSPKKCYSKCPTTSKFYNKGHNICFSGSCLDSTNNPYPLMIYSKFSIDQSEFVCYSICTDVYSDWKGYRTEDYQCIFDPGCPSSYPYEYDKICYKAGCPNAEMKKKNQGSVIQCYFDCPADSATYIQGKDCVSTCDSNHPFKIEPTVSNVGVCLTESEGCSINGFEYFDKEHKRCKSSCDGKMIEINLETGKPYISSQGTCVANSCPTDYPYEFNGICYKNGCPALAPFTYANDPKKCLSKCNANDFEFNGNQCVSTCKGIKDVYYIADTGSGRKICVNKCPDILKYFFASDGKCLNECKNGSTFKSYNPLTYECLDSCNSVAGYEYDMNSNDKSYPCLASCPADKPYHKETDKKCLNACPNYISAEDNFKCVDSCGNNKKLGSSKQCSKECTVNYPYLMTTTDNGVDSYSCVSKCDGTSPLPADYKYLIASTKQCVTQCPSDENYVLDNICYSQCPKEYNYYEKVENNKKCVRICSDTNSKPYHLKGQNECITDCPDTQKYVIDGTDSCLVECPAEYPHGFKLSVTSNTITCKDKCNSNQVLSDNKCVNGCDPNYKPFLLKETNECYSACPSNYPYYKDDNGKKICVAQCDKYISSTNKCVDHCESNERFITKGKKCKAGCEEKDGIYYYESDTNGYSIYSCAKICPNDKPLRLVNDTQCYQNCPSSSPYQAPDNFCYASCKNNLAYPFTLKTTNVCAASCDSENKYYYESDKKCLSSCNGDDVINEFNQCVPKCGLNDSKYKFNFEKKCYFTCPKEKPNYIIGEYNCLSGCTSTYKHKRPSNVCADSCDQTSSYPFEYKLNDPDDQFECLISCRDDKPYYNKNEKKCSDKCTDFVIQDTNECVSTCTGLIDTPFSYIKDTNDNTFDGPNTKFCVRKCIGEKPFLTSGNKCSSSCSDDYPFYKEEEKICLPECPSGYYTNGTICYNECPLNSYLLIDKCVNSCPTDEYGYKYYFPLQRECLLSCGEGFYSLDNNTCVDSCLTDNKFAQGNKCVDKCNNDSPYYIKDIKITDLDQQRHCLRDCPIDYQYLTNNYECMIACPNETRFFVNDPNRIAKVCKNQCDGDRPFVGDNNECLENCPDDKPFYVNTNVNKKCYKECPYTNPYHYENNFVCVSSCDKIYYEKELCVHQCTESQYTFSDGNYCFDNCKKEDGFFKTQDHKCVLECPTSTFFMADDQTNNCVCQNLYYLNESTGYLICIDPTINDCKTYNSSFFTLQGSKKCVKTCSGVLSLDGFCTDSYECPANTVAKDIGNGIMQCKCSYRYYIDSYNQTICLAENEECPYNYPLFFRENNQCVKNCPDNYSYSFNGLCYSQCPVNSKANGTECKCENTYRLNDLGEFECYSTPDSCPDNQILIHGEKECLPRCSGVNKIFFNYECYSKCPNVSDIIKVTNDKDPVKQFADWTCQCKNYWRYTNEGDPLRKECGNTTTTCKDLFPLVPLPLVVLDTRQCSSKCPDLYPYKFNYECYSDCENHANSHYSDMLKTKSENECECKGSYITNTSNSRTIVVCIEDTVCNTTTDLIRDETNECYHDTNVCPNNLLRFNRRCYSKCPDNTKYDSRYARECVCENLRYNITVGNTEEVETHCIHKSVYKCPDNRPYLVVDKKECLEDIEAYVDQGYKYILNNNNLYKDKCPLYTKENEGNYSNPNIKECICDPYYFWYVDDRENDNLVCGLTQCPEIKKFYLYETHECKLTCVGMTDFYVYKNACYNSSCPDGTTLKEGSDYECELIPLTNASDVKELHDMIASNIKTIFSEAPRGGYLYTAYNASVQIVGLDRKLETNKDIIMKNNLSYINFSSCINQLYQELDADDQIILFKMDMLNGSESYLINRVEYEIYSSKSGEKLDITKCQAKSLIISYPINYRISDYDTISSQGIKNDINSLYKLGKEINQKYGDKDTFNHKDDLYHDHCSSLEINGKDMILRERPNNLYPNITFCEDGCEYYQTDFKEDRINCLCDPKMDFDVYREQNSMNYNFSKDEIDSEQKGPSTLPVFQCFKSLEVENNGGFGYCLAVAAAEVALVSLGATLGFSSLTSTITKKLNIGQSANKGNQKEVDTENKNLKVAGPSSANPPPKENEDLIINDTTELIPAIYCKMFFTYKDNGVTKEVKRSKLPFKVRPQTIYLYEPIPGASYKPVFNNPTMLKQNIIKIIDDPKPEKASEAQKSELLSKNLKAEDQKNANKSVKGNNFLNKADNDNIDPSKSNVKSIANKNGDATPEIKISNIEDKEALKLKNNRTTKEKPAKRGISNQPKELGSEELDLYENGDTKKYKYQNFTDFDKDSLTDSQNSWRLNANLYENEDVIYLMRVESRYKDLPFKEALKRDDLNTVVIIITFIADKVYLTKTLLLLKRYDVFYAFFSLYILCHILLLGFITCFFNLDTLSKIYNRDDFPTTGFYLLTGLYTNLIVWVVYKLLLCLLQNNNRIMSHIAFIENHKDNEKLTDEMIKEKTEKMISSIKKRMIIYFVIQFVLVVLCFIYITLFCSVYSATKVKLFNTYLNALVEILIFRVVYGVILGFLRKISLVAQSECLYKVVKFLDVHLS